MCRMEHTGSVARRDEGCPRHEGGAAAQTSTTRNPSVAIALSEIEHPGANGEANFSDVESGHRCDLVKLSMVK
jgi:hypothetical protein